MAREQVRAETLIGKNFGLDAEEKRLIAMLVAGHGNEEIREALGFSKRELRDRILRIFRKLRVTNRLELILFSTYHRIVDDARPTSAEPVLTRELPTP